MSNIVYNPVPPRAWSRVQNRCLDLDNPTGRPVFIPFFNKTVPPSQVQGQLNMINKGNVLQYKKNSSNLTNQQRYSQIAKGMWINRNTTWATQSVSYTNPNTTSLKRVNYTTITPDGGATDAPITCPVIVYPTIPPALPTPGGPLPYVPPPVPEPLPIVIPDGGTLICSVVENICTGEIIRDYTAIENCHPTSDSDVPGPVRLLCWNDGAQTWYPRQRYVMTNSGNKWPEGYKGFVSGIKLPAPILTGVSVALNSVDLSWTWPTNECYSVAEYYIFQNSLPIQIVTSIQTSVRINGLLDPQYSFYIIGVNNEVTTEPSNIVTVNVLI